MSNQSCKQKNNDLRRKAVLQAVVLADSFSRHFSPTTYERPKALLSLVNTPLIEYALHFLAVNGVNEVFVVCRAFATVVATHANAYTQRYSHQGAKMSVQIVTVSEECSSVGDVFRHIHSMEIIHSDPFIIMGADTVADIKLAEIVAAQRRRAMLDPLNIMTVVLKQAEHHHRIRSSADELVVAIAESDNRLISYQNVRHASQFRADIKLMAQQSSVRFRNDLFDTHILVCSPDVLTLFHDEFDWQNVERDLFSQVLAHSAVEHRIFAHIVSERYAARVNCWKSFNAISKDIIERWVFYFSLDHNVFEGNHYSYQRVNVYKEGGVRLAQSSVVEENSVVGEGTRIDDNSIVSRSVLGRHCSVGTNVKIDGSYLWGNVRIESDVIIDHALLCDNVVVKRGAVVHRGAVLSFGVVIGEGVSVPAYTKAWIPPHNDDDDDDEDVNNGNSGVVEDLSLGVGCVGVRFRFGSDDNDKGVDIDGSDVSEDESDSDVDSESSLDEDSRAIRDLARVSASSIAPDQNAISWWDKRCRMRRQRRAASHCFDSEFELDDDIENESVLTFANSDKSELGESLPDADIVDWDQDQEQRFRVAKLYNEISATLRRSIEKKIDDRDAIMLEISSLKFSENASILQYSASVLLALFDEIDPVPNVSDTNPTHDVLVSLSHLLRNWKFLLENFSDEEADQLAIILGLETACLFDGKPYYSLFTKTLQFMYKIELIADEAIDAWARRCEVMPSNSPQQALRQAADALVEFVRPETDNESSEEEEENDSD